MNKYHKGVAIEVIQEETLALEEGVPNFMTLEADILSIYLNFINKKYFCEGLIKKSQIEIK